MPGKGGNKRRRGKKDTNNNNKNLILADSDQQYAKILDRLGGNPPKMRLKLTNGTEILGSVRGKLRKRVWMQLGDLVLVSNRDFQVDRVDIIGKYDGDQVRKLKRKGEIPSNFMDKESDTQLNDDDPFDVSDYSDNETDILDNTHKNVKSNINTTNNLDDFDFDDI